MKRKLSLLLFFCCGMLAAKGLYYRSGAEEFKTAWKNSVPNALTVDSKGAVASKPLRLTKRFGVPRGKYKALRLTLTTGKAVSSAPCTVIAIFIGGKVSGNHYWNFTIRPGDAASGTELIRDLTIPADSNCLELLLQMGEHGSTVPLKSVEITGLTAAHLADRAVTLKVDTAKTVSKPTPFHFGVNMVGHFSGVRNGTLPGEQNVEKRRTFARFLKDCGIRSARYPGGTESHWYLPESKELSQKLYKMNTGRNVPDLVPFTEFADAMHEAGVKVIYQLNTSFFVDEKNTIQPIASTRFTRNCKLPVTASRHVEAGAALERAFQKGILSGKRVDYWEIGNEEFAYMTPAQYADVCAAFLPVIAKYDPGKPICVTGVKNLQQELEKRNVWQYVTGVTTHYPYASWPRPAPSYKTADYDAFARADVRFSGNLSKRGGDGKKISVSETSIFNLWTYEPFRIQPSFAQALALCYNWGKLLSDPRVDMAVYHDFESPYFGMTRYDVSFSDLERVFKWLHGKNPPPPLKGRRANWFVDPSSRNHTRYFAKQYVPSPGTHCYAMLAEFSGGTLYQVDAIASDGAPGGYYAGVSADGKATVVASNPLNIPVALKLDYPGFPEKCKYRQLDAYDNSAVTPNEYRLLSGTMVIPKDGILLPARSILLLQAE
ncbi:MAG: hypothetical protein J6C40_12425 [Lentisphaeria bacterium]|nr:hypothetical protein [Lentisphaeria bacterium]